VVGRVYPRRWIKENSFPFKPLKIERNGKIYDKLKIKKWKLKLPDASLFFHKIFKKIPTKRLEGNKKEKIAVLIKESCVAEMTHFVALVLGFFCIKIWKNMGGWIVSIVFMILNLPFILIQRYNRPRFINALA